MVKNDHSFRSRKGAWEASRIGDFFCVPAAALRKRRVAPTTYGVPYDSYLCGTTSLGASPDSWDESGDHWTAASVLLLRTCLAVHDTASRVSATAISVPSPEIPRPVELAFD